MSDPFKILVIGNSNTAKSSLVKRFVKNMWDDNYVQTEGVNFVILYYAILFYIEF